MQCSFAGCLKANVYHALRLAGGSLTCFLLRGSFQFNEPSFWLRFCPSVKNRGMSKTGTNLFVKTSPMSTVFKQVHYMSEGLVAFCFFLSFFLSFFWKQYENEHKMKIPSPRPHSVVVVFKVCMY